MMNGLISKIKYLREKELEKGFGGLRGNTIVADHVED